MKERSPFSAKFVDLQLLENKTLSDTLKKSMKKLERHHLSVNFVYMQQLVNNTLDYTFRQYMKEKNHLSVNFVYMQHLKNNTLTNIFRQSTRVWSNTSMKNSNVNFVHIPLPKSYILLNMFNQFMKKRNHVNICFMNMFHLTVHDGNCEWGKEYKSFKHELTYWI